MSDGGKTALFIDGANIEKAARALNFRIDYKKLRKKFSEPNGLLQAYYYTAIKDTDEYAGRRRLTDWLSFNGYTVVQKFSKEFRNEDGSTTIKGNMDVELAVGAMEIAHSLKRAVIFSGDGDFRSLVESLQRRGVFVTVVSAQPMTAGELRRQADEFIYLEAIQKEIQKDIQLAEEIAPSD